MWPTPTEFIAKWKDAKGGERAQAQSFVIDLCHLLGVAVPHDGDYKFEYPLKGETGTDFADLYKRGCFIWEAKQSRAKGQKKAGAGLEEAWLYGGPARLPLAGRSWDALMVSARHQAIRYASRLPHAHGRPPFILICDVGHCIETFADFSGRGLHYEEFPDEQSFCVRLADFERPEIRARFRAIWEEPMALDPALQQAEASRGLARALADITGRLIDMNRSAEEFNLALKRRLAGVRSEAEVVEPEEASVPGLRRKGDES